MLVAMNYKNPALFANNNIPVPKQKAKIEISNQ
jgi:hypothetical protein